MGGHRRASLVDLLRTDPPAIADAEVVSRDRSITELENTLSGSCWDLWEQFDAMRSQSQHRNRGVLEPHPGRESSPHSRWHFVTGNSVAAGASQGARLYDPLPLPRATELPCETSPFAKALGFAQRSALENNGAGGAHKLTGADTESSNLNWKDSMVWSPTTRTSCFWHHWLDNVCMTSLSQEKDCTSWREKPMSI